MSERDYSWAEYLVYMEGGTSDVVSLPAKPAAPPAKKTDLIRGVILALAVTVTAIFVSELPFAPFTLGGKHPIEPVMLAIVFGMIVSNAWTLPQSLQPGIKYAVKTLLPLGIVLLGVRLDFLAMVKVGAAGLALSILETAVTLALLALLVRWMNLPRKLGTLLGVGTAICGGTAIVATAPVIEAEEKDVSFSVATVTLLGLIAMLTLPVIGHVLALSSKAFGIWAGLAIHQTPQVVAAGFAYSEEAGDTATIVKLARVCLLAPVVFAIGLLYARRKSIIKDGVQHKNINYWRLFPMFVLGFLAMALVRTLGLVPVLHLNDAGFLAENWRTINLGNLAEQLSRFFIVISMAGVGLETKFSAMKQTGLMPLFASSIAVVVVAVLILGLIRWMGI